MNTSVRNGSKVAKHLDSQHSAMVTGEYKTVATRIIAGTLPLLSSNTKTDAAIGLPLMTCSPDVSCAEHCYAAGGREVMPVVMNRRLAMLDVINQSAGDAALMSATVARLYSELTHGKVGRRVLHDGTYHLRWNAQGDLTVPSCKVINALVGAHSDVRVYLYTRKPQLVAFLNVDYVRAGRIVVNASLSSDPRVLQAWAEADTKLPAYMPFIRKTFLRVSADDVVPADVAVVFPIRHHASEIPEDSRDCPADRMDGGAEAERSACMRCRRCVLPVQS